MHVKCIKFWSHQLIIFFYFSFNIKFPSPVQKGRGKYINLPTMYFQTGKRFGILMIFSAMVTLYTSWLSDREKSRTDIAIERFRGIWHIVSVLLCFGIILAKHLVNFFLIFLVEAFRQEPTRRPKKRLNIKLYSPQAIFIKWIKFVLVTWSQR